MIISLCALVLGGVGLGVALSDDDAGGGGGEGAAAATVSELAVDLAEFNFSGGLTAPAGQITVALTNVGSVDHNFKVRGGPESADVPSGGSGSLDLSSLTAGTYEVYCSIPGHEAAGMVAELVVTSSGEAVTADGHGGHGDEVDYEALDQAMTDSILAYPAATEGLGNQPLEPTILADGTKQFTLVAEIIEWEVEAGKIVEGWAYNGQIPGPEIRVQPGDNVQIIVENKLPMSTDVHWHGFQTPNAMDGVAPITQSLIGSGETFVYEFEARKNAIGMYHAHHHAQVQVPNGMFGTFIIGDAQIPYGQTISGVTIPEDLEIAAEIPMVLNDAGTIGFSLNGKSFPATAPLVLQEGDWAVINYYNEGLVSHPMHMHQFPQLIFAKDGIPLDQPYWADTINIAPGERYSVLINAEEAGTWVWHCHILTHVERSTGMFGMVTALVVQPRDA